MYIYIHYYGICREYMYVCISECCIQISKEPENNLKHKIRQYVLKFKI